MTTAWGSVPPNLSGSTQTHWGADGIGILGSVMKAAWTAGEHGASPLANDGLVDGLEYRWYAASVPAGCSLDATELGDAQLTVPADGTYVWTYRLVESGVLLATVGSVSTTAGAGSVSAAAAGLAAFTATATAAVVASVTPLALAVAAAGAGAFGLLASGSVVVTVTGVGMAAGRYASQSDLVARFGAAELAQLTDAAAGASIDAAMVSRALADADAQIDLALRKRYALPLASVPEVLVRLACDIARYLLWDVRAADQVRARYKDATALLDRIAAGDVLLGDAVALPPTALGVAVVARSPARRFSDTLMDAAFGRIS